MNPLSIPIVGWATAVSLLAALAGWYLWVKHEDRKKHAEQLKEAIAAYRAAVADGDPDRIHIAARWLRQLRQQDPG